jgi:hypothetical protein
MSEQSRTVISVESRRRRRTVVALALSIALLAVPALASAASTSSTLASQNGFCSYGGPTAGAAVGKAQITTSTATSEGFHSVRVDLRIKAHQVPVGEYQVWLVNLYRDDAGAVAGCSASPLASALNVKAGGADFHGSALRYTGAYELQVYVGPIFGPGWATAPALVDVP